MRLAWTGARAPTRKNLDTRTSIRFLVDSGWFGCESQYEGFASWLWRECYARALAPARGVGGRPSRENFFAHQFHQSAVARPQFVFASFGRVGLLIL